eukprot:2057414-Amphidinium_carterae.1
MAAIQHGIVAACTILCALRPTFVNFIHHNINDNLQQQSTSTISSHSVQTCIRQQCSRQYRAQQTCLANLHCRQGKRLRVRPIPGHCIRICCAPQTSLKVEQCQHMSTQP